MSWDEGRNSYDQVHHEGKFSHELLSGAAAFGGMKLFEDHQRKEGKEVSHGFAKELIAGFVGAEVDKLAETKGEDFVDRERAKHDAKEHAERMYNDQYGGYDDYRPEHPSRHDDYQRREY